MENERIVCSPYPPIKVPNLSIGEYFVETVSRFEDKIVIYDSKTDETLTAKQLIEKSHNIAVALLNRGITKSDIALFFSENLVEYAITQFAIYLLGITFTFSNKNNAVYELSEQIKDSGATVIFTSTKLASITDKVLENRYIRDQIKFSVTFDGTHDGYIRFSDLIDDGFGKTLEKVPHFPIDLKNDICVISYTSGTTGLPKGAIWTHYSLLGQIMQPVMSNQTETNSYTFGCNFPFTHSSGTFLFPRHLFAGFAIVIIDYNKDEDIFEAIDKYRITALGVYPSFGLKLLDDSVTDKYDLSSLSILVSGGTPFPYHLVKPIIDKYNLDSFTHVYGITEVGSITYMYNVDDVYIPGSNGYLAHNFQLKVRHLTSGESLAANQSGELCVRSVNDTKSSGYLNNPKATRDAFDENGWYLTGDIGYYDDNGRIFITDRIKELIKYSSYSIAPAEIEQFLLTHEAIEDAAVVGVPHPIDNQWLRAYVVLKKDKTLSEEEVLEYVSNNLGSRKQLRSGVVFVDKIVKTLIGKIDRKYYRQLVMKQ